MEKIMKHLKLFEAYNKGYKPDKYGLLNLDEKDLTTLPELPDGLKTLRCNYNKLTSLPELPETLTNLLCIENEISYLPKLPDGLRYLLCYDNPLKCLIPNKFVRVQSGNWLKSYYYPYIKSYEGQKNILTREPWMLNELILQSKKIHPKIKEEFAHLFTGSELNLLN